MCEQGQIVLAGSSFIFIFFLDCCDGEMVGRDGMHGIDTGYKKTRPERNLAGTVLPDCAQTRDVWKLVLFCSINKACIIMLIVVENKELYGSGNVSTTQHSTERSCHGIGTCQ